MFVYFAKGCRVPTSRPTKIAGQHLDAHPNMGVDRCRCLAVLAETAQCPGGRVNLVGNCQAAGSRWSERGYIADRVRTYAQYGS